MSSRLIFPSAKEARRLSFERQRVHIEVRSIEEHIINSINNGKLSVEINDTRMTSYEDGDEYPTGETYYSVWRNKKNDRVLENEMNVIISYFKDLGYSITRKPYKDKSLFYWEIKW